MQASWQQNYRFDRGMTAGPDPRQVSANSGFGYASFLLGAGSGGSNTNGIRPAMASKSYGLYVQDDWKATRKLTLNIGVRWDVETGVTERYDRYAVFDPDVRSPLSDQAGFDMKGGWLFPNQDLESGRNLRSPEWSRFAPRVGLAYELQPGFVLRAGYGIFYAMAPWGANYYGTAPFRASTPWLASLDGVTPNDTLSNPFPGGVLIPEGSSGGLTAANGLGVGGPVPLATMTTPYNQQWNFTIAKQLGNETALEVAYAGNKGTNLPIRNGWQMDQLHPDQIKPENGLLELVDNPLFGIVPVGTMAQPKVQRGQLLTPYPQYPGATFQAPGWGNSNYHSFQAKLTKRFGGGGSVVAAYTFSKLMSDGGDNAWDSALWRNYYCRACEKSLSPYHQPQRFVASFTYELPFGRNKQFGSGWNGLANAILGQWQTNGIFTLNSGLIQELAAPGNTSFSFGGRQFPDSTGVEAKLDNPTIDRWFDTDQFTIPQQYTFGNVSRVHPTITSDFVETLDFSLFKDFNLTERVKLQFRAEWFNLPNHPIFANPAGTVGSGSFGRVTSQANSPRQTQLALKILF
jgi:hypothetical protein